MNISPIEFNQMADEEFVDKQVKELEAFFSEVEKKHNVILVGNRNDLNTKAKKDFLRMTKAQVIFAVSKWKLLISNQYSV